MVEFRTAASIAVTATLGVVTGCSKAAGPTPPLRVAAAADLAFAFREVGDAFSKMSGLPAPTFSFGSTGLLEKQIEQGAPFDVFAAANVSYADQAVKAGACDGATRKSYGRGRLVVWTSKGAAAAPPRTLADLADVRFRKVAIANPEHAPYGRAAEQVLEHLGLWDAIKSKLVFGENVQETLQFAVTGNADAAVVALSLAIVTKDGVSLPIDESLHAPIDQTMVLCKAGGNRDAGARFEDFVNGPDGRAIMKRYGFLLPGEG
ncbi:MAG TPA: molybdate ABC transporter substrate-binding protein [Polyangiaceae bacterium]|jgi:molybdate transport system substrate-binding protein|nr:molybdate ABC transporter substrate-binding protein [Polyangiaceae bacterium]